MAAPPTVKSGAPSGLSVRDPKAIAWLPLATVKVLAHLGAALYVPLPAWSASIVQLPACRSVINPVLVTEHAAEAVEYATASPDDAVAAVAGAGWSNRTPASAGNVMVWLAAVTVKPCATWGAAFQLALPAWSASIVQVPAATMWTVVPDTVQTGAVAEVKVTARPEEAVALMPKSGSPRALSARVPKAIVWLPLATVKPWVTWGAAL